MLPALLKDPREILVGDHRPRNKERLEEGKPALVLSDGFSASTVLEQLLVFSWKQSKTKNTKHKKIQVH